MAKIKSPLEGRWRITWMDQWDQDFVDAEVEGYFEFGPNDIGSFQFGYVQGEIDYRKGVRDANPSVEFTWDGNDESGPAQGRGWAVLDGNEIKGMIFIHQGKGIMRIGTDDADDLAAFLRQRTAQQNTSPTLSPFFKSLIRRNALAELP